MQFLIWILSGVLAGWLAGLLIRGRGFGLVGDLLIGLLGRLLGGVVLVAIVRVLRWA